MNQENIALVKAAQVDEAYQKFIESASPNLLRVIVKGCGIGARVWKRKKVKVVATIGRMERAEYEVDRVDVYLDSPFHSLPVSTAYAHANVDGCKRWLAEQGIRVGGLDTIRLDQPQPDIDDEIDELLLSNLEVLEAIRSEILSELDDANGHVKFSLGFEFPEEEVEFE